MALLYNIYNAKDELYMLKYKIDILSEFKKNGYNTTRIRKEKITGERQMQEFRTGKVTITGINLICRLTNLQPGDFLEYLPDDPNQEV